METYDVDYFIKKFERIHEHRWCTEKFRLWSGKRCGVGHCLSDEAVEKLNSGYRVLQDDERKSGMFAEAFALANLFQPTGTNKVLAVYRVNNGNDPRYQQPTPKQRILAALRDIKAKQEPVKEVPVKERTVYVTVDAAVRKLQKEIAEN